MEIFIDIKTKEKIIIVKSINDTTVRVKRLRDNKEYFIPKNELVKSNFD